MDLNNFLVKGKEAYPEIVGATNNPQTIAVLKNLMSSQDSELKAVLQYFYQSSVSHDLEKDISKILEEISIVEMVHMELLSHAIVDFGGEPKYENSQGQYFNTATLNYSAKLREMLELDIKKEEHAIESYKRAIQQVDNESLKQLFKRIIEDEELHIKILTYLRDNVKFMSY